MQYEKHRYPVIDLERTGRKIEFYMKQKNITMKQLQEYLGLSCVQSIYRWIKGINLPSVDHLYAMSELFQVTIDDMICGDRRLLKRSDKLKSCRRFLSYYRGIHRMYAA